MINILIVDDLPELKVSPAIEYLEMQHLDFGFEIVRSVNSALRYIVRNSKQIDLIIVDLGLPLMDDEYGYDKLNGLKVIDTMLFRKIRIPVIINSNTEIPNEDEYLASRKDNGITIEHVNCLDGQWLSEFIRHHLL